MILDRCALLRCMQNLLAYSLWKTLLENTAIFQGDYPLYRVESNIADRSDEERLKAHQEISVPIPNEFKQ